MFPRLAVFSRLAALHLRLLSDDAPQAPWDVRRPPSMNHTHIILLRAVVVACLQACAPGSSVVGGPVRDAAVVMDALDVPDLLVTRDATDADAPRPSCVVDRDCADLVACTVDTCRAGRCQHEPSSALCPAGSACEVTRGCRAVRACGDATACGDDDPCTLNERCDPDSRVCVFDELPTDTPCGPAGSGRSCRGGACQCPVDRAAACGERCVDTASDSVHCGRCSNACAAGAWCNAGSCSCPAPQVYCPAFGCADTSADLGNCGACGVACPAGSQCLAGRCVVPCAMGTHRCGAACLADDGAASCGTRCEPCTAPAGGTARCTLASGRYACDFSCALGTHRCGDQCVSDGAVASCGTRCQPCVSPGNGTVACVGGTCVITCGAGFHLCGERCLPNDAVASCGARCDPCATPEHGTPVCSAGACGFTCSPGFMRCGDACSDGTSPLGCGPSCTRCAVPVNGVATCTAAVCGLRCNPNTHLCGANCARDDDPGSCGARCAPCPAPAHGRATCVSAACDFVCDAGYVRLGSVCRELPQLKWPPSATHVTSRRPMLQWVLPLDVDPDASDTVVEICRDRGCLTLLTTLRPRGNRGAPAADLPRGTVFWRLRAGALTSPVWTFATEGADTPAGVTPGGGAIWGVVPDFNGDGFDDVAVGMPFRGAPAPGVTVYAGSAAGLQTGTAITLDAPADASLYGFSVAALGDVNGDGYCDLAVGAPGAAHGLGQAFVYHGGAGGLRTTPDTVLTSTEAGDTQFGVLVVAGGDLNGDGYSDLVVSAPSASVTGRAYIYFGSSSGVGSSPTILIPTDTTMVRFGISIATAGDFDGDGDSDLVVGADATNGFQGAAYLFTGATFGVSATTMMRYTRSEGGQFGAAVAGIGDSNADGLPDFAVGSPGYDSGRGRVFVYHGNRLPTVSAAAVVIPGLGGTDADFGGVLAAAGDVDGDGADDLLVGAPRRNGYTGAAYLLAGSAGGVATTATQGFEGEAVGSSFGGGFAGARDFDRDGFVDAVFAAERMMSFRGRVTVYRGGATGLANPVTIDGPVAGARFGFSVAMRLTSSPAPGASRAGSPEVRNVVRDAAPMMPLHGSASPLSATRGPCYTDSPRRS